MRADDLPAIRAAGLLGAVLAVERLLASQASGDPQRWRRMSLAQLLDHLGDHADRVCENPGVIDHDSGRPEAEHVAARALMVIATIEARMDDYDCDPGADHGE